MLGDIDKRVVVRKIVKKHLDYSLKRAYLREREKCRYNKRILYSVSVRV